MRAQLKTQLIRVSSAGMTASNQFLFFCHWYRQIRPPDYNPRLWYVHDDMYFGSSKDSVGIQLADLCGYFIAKHLEGDVSIDGFDLPPEK